jgi:Do/DeqQ family serine protease
MFGRQENTQMTRRTIWAAILATGLGALLAGIVPGGEAGAQQLPTSRDSLQFSYAPLVKKVSPAVVNIYTATTTRAPQRRMPFPFPGMPQEGSNRVQNALGSGVVVKPDGLIVTNAHVVRGADEIRVVLADRREFDAKILAQDERYDLALLRIDTAGEKFPFLELRDSDSIEVGDVVMAIGNPFGLNQTVTSGIISAVARSAGGVNDSSFFLQTDAAINPGNSGGALVSLDGRLIGINTAIYSQTGGSVGIGFATPSNIVARMIDTGSAGGRIVRPWLGISMQPVTADLATGLNLPRPAGLVVKEVFPGGPGEKAQIKRNDVIVGLRDQPIDDEATMRFRLSTLGVGETVPIKVIRAGRELVLQLPLAAPPEDPPREKSALDGRQPLSGATVVNLSPAMAEELGLIEWKPGVAVIEVKAGSYAARFLRVNDMVIAINGKEVKDVTDLKTRIAAGVSSLSVGREGMVSTIQFR